MRTLNFIFTIGIIYLAVSNTCLSQVPMYINVTIADQYLTCHSIKLNTKYATGVSILVFKSKTGEARYAVSDGFNEYLKCYFDFEGDGIFYSDTVLINSIFNTKTSEIIVHNTLNSAHPKQIKTYYYINNRYIEKIGNFTISLDSIQSVFQNTQLVENLKVKGAVLNFYIYTTNGTYKCPVMFTRPYNPIKIQSYFKFQTEENMKHADIPCYEGPKFGLLPDDLWFHKK